MTVQEPPSGNRQKNALVVVLLCALLFCYWRYQTRANAYYEVLQVTPANLTFEVLNERNPVIVRKGAAKDPVELVTEAMRYTYVSLSSAAYDAAGADVNDANAFRNVDGRYVVLACGGVGGVEEVEVVHPGHVGNPNFRSVSVVLNEKTALILPLYWAYRRVGERAAGGASALQVITVHNLFSYARSLWTGTGTGTGGVPHQQARSPAGAPTGSSAS